MRPGSSASAPPPSPVDRRRWLILASVLVVAVCGLVYELVAGAVAGYLLGDTVTQYSLVIGSFLSAMGIGSFLTRFVHRELLAVFLGVQVAVGLAGGFSGMLLFVAFAAGFDLTVVVLGLAAVVGALVGMEVPLLLRILRGRGSLRVDVAHVLTLDYAGALVASVAFPFLLLPFLGLVRAALVLGLLNVAVAALGTGMFWRELTPRIALAAGTGVALGLLGGGLLSSGVATTWVEDRLYQDEIIVAETTPYQRIVVTRWRGDIRLFLDGHLQFSTADEYRYHEALVYPTLAFASAHPAAAADPLRVLVLGGGDGLAVRRVLEFDTVAAVDLVDIDGRVVELFRDLPLLARHNGGALEDPRVTVHVEDALAFLRRTRAASYDVVVMDLPDPSSVETNKLYSRSFFGLALKSLTARGALVTQATSPFYARQAFWCIARTLESAAAELRGAPPFEPLPYHVHVPSFGDWGFVLVAPAGLVRPADLRLPGHARYMTGDVFRRALVFPADSGPVETQVNRLDDPVLLRYHRRGWARWNE